jgi:hypothetical protein
VKIDVAKEKSVGVGREGASRRFQSEPREDEKLAAAHELVWPKMYG